MILSCYFILLHFFIIHDEQNFDISNVRKYFSGVFDISERGVEWERNVNYQMLGAWMEIVDAHIAYSSGHHHTNVAFC